MPLVNIPPDNHIYGLGKITGQLRLYNSNDPAAVPTQYDVMVVGVNNWSNVEILPGATHIYPPAGNSVWVCNHGPGALLAQPADVEEDSRASQS